MRERLYNCISNFISYSVITVIGIIPLLFLNLTTDFYDMPKLILLLTAWVILTALWIISWIVQGKIVVIRTPLDIPLTVLLLGILISSFFSSSRITSIYGIFPDVHGSAVSWSSYIILYFLASSHLKNAGKIKLLFTVLLADGILLAVVSIMSFFGIFLPFPMTKGVNFTPTGSGFSNTALLLMLLPLPLLSLLNPGKYISAPVALLISTLFCVSIVLTGNVPLYIILLLVFVLCLFVSRPFISQKTLTKFLVPFAVSALTLILAYVPFEGNKIQNLEYTFPKEVQLPLSVSWKISATSFIDAPLTGSGPGTYLYNFTSRKPVEFNQSRFWNFSFGNASNEFLQVLGTWGLVGLLPFLFTCLTILMVSRKNLHPQAGNEKPGILDVYIPALAISGLLSIFLMLIHTTTLTFLVISLTLVSALMVLHRHGKAKTSELSIGIKAYILDDKQIDLLPVTVFILFLVGAVPFSIRFYNAVSADYYHRLALAQADKNGALTYQYLQRAETLNPYIDLYRVDIAQTNFAIANALVLQKGPSQANPQGTLTDQDKQTVQTLITQAVNEGRASVTLNPRSSRNWEVMALIYRSIAGVVDNSPAYALDAYGRAIQNDPYSPSLRLNVGLLYHSAKDYEMATRFFTDAVTLKPDYVSGYYNLAITLRDKGDLQNSLLAAEKAVNLLQSSPQSQDYKLASALVKEVREKIAAGNVQTNVAKVEK